MPVMLQKKAFAAKSPAGFTLIELLVVIAIIAILAAILFPVFAQAREKARQSACLNNAKQLGTAVMTYVQDYDECYPSNWFGSGLDAPWQYRDPMSGTKTGRYRWSDAVYPYVKSEQVFNCPDAPRNNRFTFKYAANLTATVDDNTANNYEGAYCANVFYWDGDIGTPPTTNGTDPPVKVATIEAPAETIWITEGDGSYQCAIDNVGYNDYAKRDPQLARGKIGRSSYPDPPADGKEQWLEGGVVPRHQGRATIVWADGHAKNMDLKTMLTKGKPIDKNRPNDTAYKYFTGEDD